MSTITLTNLDIENIVAYANNDEAIVNKTNKFSAKFAWNWRKNMKKLRDLNAEFTSLRQDLIDRYSADEYSYTREEDGARIVKEDYVEEYNTRLQELYMESNDIEVNTVKIDHLLPGGSDALDSFEISVAELEVLAFMIEDEE